LIADSDRGRVTVGGVEWTLASAVHTVCLVTSPQDPWQQGGYPQGSYPQQGPPSSGFPQQGPVPDGFSQPVSQPGGFPQQAYQPYPQGNPFAAPPVSTHEMAGLQRPSTVTIAFWISVAVPLIATVLSSLSGLLIQDMFTSAAGGGDDEVTSLISTFSVVGTGFLIVCYAILTCLWIVFGFQMRNGRNWARVLLVVAGGFWLMQSIGGLIGTSSTLGPGSPMPAGWLVLSYCSYGLVVVSMIAFLVLVFMPQSNWYFQAAGRR
jgi:hypothetical protein